MTDIKNYITPGINVEGIKRLYGRVSPTERILLERLVENFSKADEDGDGFLSASEIKNLAKKGDGDESDISTKDIAALVKEEPKQRAPKPARPATTQRSVSPNNPYEYFLTTIDLLKDRDINQAKKSESNLFLQSALNQLDQKIDLLKKSIIESKSLSQDEILKLRAIQSQLSRSASRDTQVVAKNLGDLLDILFDPKAKPEKSELVKVIQPPTEPTVEIRNTTNPQLSLFGAYLIGDDKDDQRIIFSHNVYGRIDLTHGRLTGDITQDQIDRAGVKVDVLTRGDRNRPFAVKFTFTKPGIFVLDGKKIVVPGIIELWNGKRYAITDEGEILSKPPLKKKTLNKEDLKKEDGWGEGPQKEINGVKAGQTK